MKFRRSIAQKERETVLAHAGGVNCQDYYRAAPMILAIAALNKLWYGFWNLQNNVSFER
jgi:hypothetical protein